MNDEYEYVEALCNEVTQQAGAQHADFLAMQKKVLDDLFYLHHMASLQSNSQWTKERTTEAAREIAAALGMSKEFTGE